MRMTQTLLSTVAELRMAKALKQRQPVPQILVASKSPLVKKALTTYSSLLRDQANSRRLRSVSTTSFSNPDQNRFADAKFAEGTIFLDLKLTKNELAEGLARDVVRRMQQMRKEMDLKVDAFVHAYLIAPSPREAALLKSKKQYIAGEVRAKQIKISSGEVKIQLPYYTKRWQIDGATFKFGLREASKETHKGSATGAPR
jgi:isoleucyl-tRNA synthetase